MVARTSTTIALVALAVATYAYSALTHRAFYADGAYFFANLLNRQGPWFLTDDSKHMRLFANFVSQFPVSLGLKIGVTDLEILRILFGFGVFFSPLLAIGLLALLSKTSNSWSVFNFSLVSFFSSVVPSQIFAINQSILASTLVWIVMHFALSRKDRLGKLEWIALIGSSCLLFMAHENILIWGSILAGAGILNARNLRKSKFRDAPGYLRFVVFSSIAQVLFTFLWQGSHPVDSQTTSYLQLFANLSIAQLAQSGQLIGSVFSIGAMFLVLCYWHDSGFLSKRLAWITVVTASTLVIARGIQPYFAPSMIQPGVEFTMRVLITSGTALWLIVALMNRFARPMTPVSQYRPLVVLTCACVISSFMWQVAETTQWTKFEKAVESLTSQSDLSIVPYEAAQAEISKLGDEIWKYSWPWTGPALTIAVSKDTEITSFLGTSPEYSSFIVLPQKPADYPSIPFLTYEESTFLDFSSFNAKLASR